MPSCEWVLDTWLLGIAQDPLNARAMHALELLDEVR